ncbi:MAG: YkvA family protein [Gammaproteobacteria bacterium]
MFRNALAAVIREVRFYRRLLNNSRTPRAAKWCLYIGLAYLASPIDLIPDFVPLFGQLDDLLIVGGLFYLARKITPQHVIDECYVFDTPTKD